MSLPTRPLGQGILHDKLKDQVAVSIKESLTKATTILSSLHRVHSYLDILKTMPSFHSGVGEGGEGEGIKSALEQVRSIRTDTAALLQTIYLTEIGLQSLVHVDKPTPSEPTNDDLILDDTINNSALSDETQAMNSNKDDVMQGRAVVEIPSQSEVSESDPPPSKRQNLSISITKCSSCNRKFATDQLDPQQEGKCKNCRSCETPLSTRLPTTPVIKSLLTSGGSNSGGPILSSTPSKPRGNLGGQKTPKLRKVTNTPMACKVCGTSFVYRRCLFRHLRENHPEIDLNNIHEYIEIEKSTNDEVPVPDLEPESQNTSMNVTIGSEIPTPSEINDTSIMELSITSLTPGRTETGQGVEPGVTMATKMTTGGKQVYTCDICKKVFDRPYRLTRHLNIHDPNRPRVSCELCDRSFTRTDTLDNHMKTSHSDERPFKCQYTACEKSFATQSALIGHLKVHTNGKPYQCLECKASFSLLLEYKSHIRQAHADTERLRCTDCYRVFPDNASLETHRSVEHLLECEICGKRFARLAYLQLHVQVHSGENVYNCKVCSQGFNSETAYKQHMRIHSKSKGKKFHCQLCDKCFEAPSNLIAHYNCIEHREKAAELGISASTTILNTIEGDLSEMNALVDEVAMGTAMEMTPVAIPTDTMATKQISMETDPAIVLGEMNDDQVTAANIISSLAQSGSFET